MDAIDFGAKNTRNEQTEEMRIALEVVLRLCFKICLWRLRAAHQLLGG
jgi:hypothetical protein